MHENGELNLKALKTRDIIQLMKLLKTYFEFDYIWFQMDFNGFHNGWIHKRDANYYNLKRWSTYETGDWCNKWLHWSRNNKKSWHYAKYGLWRWLSGMRSNHNWYVKIYYHKELIKYNLNPFALVLNGLQSIELQTLQYSLLIDDLIIVTLMSMFILEMYYYNYEYYIHIWQDLNKQYCTNIWCKKILLQIKA